jgi:hypothetical protein
MVSVRDYARNPGIKEQNGNKGKPPEYKGLKMEKGS